LSVTARGVHAASPLAVQARLEFASALAFRTVKRAQARALDGPDSFSD